MGEQRITSDVVIVGGGVGGLSAALALAQAGVEVTVLEASPEPVVDQWGFVIWPFGTRALEWLGVLDQVKAEGCRLEAYRWYSGDGQELTSVDLSRLRNVGEWVGILPSRLVNTLKREAESSGVRIFQDARSKEIVHGKDGLVQIMADIQGGDSIVSARVLVGADGPNSQLRRMMGVRSLRWRPGGQVIITGVGGHLGFNETRQAMGAGWSGGCAGLGQGKSWIYALVRHNSNDGGLRSLKAYGDVDPQAQPALNLLTSFIEVRPWSVRVQRWAADGIILIGDAAHAMLPHLGLGASLTLEDLPVFTDVITSALRANNTRASKLSEFQRRRRARISYGRRISELWALSMTSRLPGLRFMRDLNFRRFSHHPDLIESFMREMAGPGLPRLSTRFNVWLP